MKAAKESATYGVTEQISEFISLVGIGFHPDTDFKDYVFTVSGEPIFNSQAIKKLNAQLQECFDLCTKYDLDIYEISLNLVQPILSA